MAFALLRISIQFANYKPGNRYPNMPKLEVATPCTNGAHIPSSCMMARAKKQAACCHKGQEEKRERNDELENKPSGKVVPV